MVLLTVGEQDQKSMNTDFAVEAARRARLQIFTKQLPEFLAHLKTRIPANHLRRIVLSETVTDDFGSKKIWVCKNCASVYNNTASDLFQVSSCATNFSALLLCRHEASGLACVSARSPFSNLGYLCRVCPLCVWSVERLGKKQGASCEKAETTQRAEEHPRKDDS
jgi:hypothetical protein